VGNLWNQEGIPHKGWRCIGIEDLGDGLGPGERIDYSSCQMCGQEKIRYVHLMEHNDYPTGLNVGCICSGKMQDDIHEAKIRESNMKNRSSRRINWLTRKWRHSAKGNDYLNIKNYNLGVFQNNFGGWGYRIGNKFSESSSFPTEDAAKLALFDAFWEMTES